MVTACNCGRFVPRNLVNDFSISGCKKYTSEPKSEDQILSNRNTI
jgi:hypothetical protein